MLSILANWLYMGSICYICGSFLTQFYWKSVKKEEKSGFFEVMFSGILFTTCYAQVFSLFYKVSLLANIVLIVFCIGYGVAQRNYLKRPIPGIWRILLVVAIIFACSAAGPAKLIDTDWYHAQTIRWIEEYGCVKGVANLFYALGYNNAQHYFDALFSMKCFTGQSLRRSGGFFGLLIFAHGLSRILKIKKHKHHMADALAIWEMAYSIIITAFYADPYTDTLPNILILFIMTEWMALLEEKKNDVEKYAFYCILAVFATVSKTSAVMVIGLTAYPAYLLIRDKRVADIVKYILWGFLVTIPYFITNVITTGYPVYLFTSFAPFDVPWKIDPQVLKYSVDNMIQFARIPDGTMQEALNSGFSWIPQWFLRESISHQVLYLFIVLLFLYDVLCTGKEIITKNVTEPWIILPRVCMYAGIVYWLFTIPQVKYCWAYLIFPVAVIPCYYLEKSGDQKKRIAKLLILGSAFLLILYSGFYAIRTFGYMKNGVTQYPVMQADYENHVFDKVEKNGHTFFTRVDGGDIVCGYYIFPYLDNKDSLDKLVVGEELGDGFYLE